MRPSPHGHWYPQPDVARLATALRAMCSAANSRGRLDEGGCDYNTDAGVAYRHAQETLKELGL
jgi:hypothetical protein